MAEAEVGISRVQGTRAEPKQELFEVATRADGGPICEDDAESEALGGGDISLRGGEVATAVGAQNSESACAL